MKNTTVVQLYRELLQLSRQMHRMEHWMAHQCKGHSMHHSQHYLLSLIEQHDGAIQQDLVEEMDIRPSSMSELLSKLEQADLIIREKDDDDQRVMRVRITEKGKQHVEQMKGHLSDLTINLFDCLTEEEREKLLSLIQKINTHINDKMESGNLHMMHRGMHHHEHHYSKF